MNKFKQTTEKWAEEVLAKQPVISHEETANQLQEFMLLGNLIYIILIINLYLIGGRVKKIMR